MNRFATLPIGLAVVIGLCWCPSAQAQKLPPDKPILGKTLTQWIATLKDPNPRERAFAIGGVTGLVRVGQIEIAQVAPVIFEALNDKHEEVRQAAAYAIGEFRYKPKESVPVLIKLLDDSGKYVRSSAAKALGQFRADAKDAIPKLEKALEDPAEYVPISAAISLWLIEPAKAEIAVAALIRSLGNKKDSMVRMEAASALATLGSAAKSAVPHLQAALKDSSTLVRMYSAEALGNVGGDAKSAVPALRELLNDKKEDVKKKAATALAKIDPEGLAKADLEQMQGVWRFVKIEHKGRKRKVVPNSKMVIVDNRASMLEGDKAPATFTFKLDARTQRRSIDMIGMKGDKVLGTLPGLYELEGDELRICVSYDDKRPDWIGAPAGENWEVMTFRRGEPGAFVWKTFEAEEGFTILLPGKPEKKSFFEKTMLGEVYGTHYKFRHESLSVSFMAMGSKYPINAKLPEPDKHLELERQAFIQQAGMAKLVSEKKIKLGDARGLEFVLDISEGKGVMRVRFLLVEKKVFMVSVAGTKEAVFSKDADKFFDSLKLK